MSFGPEDLKGGAGEDNRQEGKVGGGLKVIQAAEGMEGEALP